MRPEEEHHTLINDVTSTISLRHENEAKAPESDKVIICMIKFKTQHSCRVGGGGLLVRVIPFKNAETAEIYPSTLIDIHNSRVSSGSLGLHLKIFNQI